ncbi:hypothetical protein JCM33374_g117 [Metschnikowia sp. JCM 33374]|nr:hypothetical protein JCM33374_g117 [Metschnikowia sp. JCM 33374]
MITSMVTINDDYMTSKPRPGHTGLEGKNETHASNLLNFSSSNTTHMPPPVSSVASSNGQMDKFVDLSAQNPESEKKDKISTYLDMPLLISDHDGEDSEGESLNGAKPSSAEEPEAVNPSLSATQEVKRSIKAEKGDKSEDVPTTISLPDANSQSILDKRPEEVPVQGSSSAAKALTAAPESEVTQTSLTQESSNCERNKVMKIVVKYVAMKITNSFPPQSSRTVDPKEMPLDEFLMILVSRLQLSLPSFMKGIIYLFRYMDIIYLLRYVNQSNNFANYTDMGYGLKKLIIGCYRLVLARERKSKDWSSITGMSNAQINDIVRTLVGRLNGKLSIKNIELIRLRGEIFRFVKMVTKTV